MLAVHEARTVPVTPDTKIYGDGLAAAYAEFRHGPDGSRFLDPRISEWLGQSAGKILLDVGMGAGDVAIEAVTQHGIQEVWGFDNSLDMIRNARMKISTLHPSLQHRIHISQSDIRNALPYYNQRFERISSVNVGCNLDNSTLTTHFQEMARSLSDNGEILFTAPINLGEIFTSTNDAWPQQLTEVLQVLNSQDKPLATTDNKQKLLKDTLGQLHDIHRASFVEKGGKLLLVVDDMSTLPDTLKEFAINSSEMDEGQEIWRKLPGLVVPNNWHTQKYYEQVMQDAGLEWTVHSDKFVSDEERNQSNLTATDSSKQLGPLYVDKSPFAVYILRHESPETKRQRELEQRYQTIADTYQAFREEMGFKERPLPQRSPEELQSLSNELQIRLAQAFGLEDFTPLPLNGETVKKVGDDMKDGGILLMRHGPADSTLSKADQMKPPANMEVPATVKGLTQFAGTLLGIEHAVTQMLFSHPDPDQQFQFKIISSPNQRALDPANVIAKVFYKHPFEKDIRLQCMDYLDSVDDNNGNLVKGAAVWTKERADAVFGPDSYDTKTDNTTAVLREAAQTPTDPKNKVIKFTVIVGHTQDLDVANALAGRPTVTEDGEPIRSDNFGFTLFPQGRDLKDSTAMRDGFYLPLTQDTTHAMIPTINMAEQVAQDLQNLADLGVFVSDGIQQPTTPPRIGVTGGITRPHTGTMATMFHHTHPGLTERDLLAARQTSEKSQSITVENQAKVAASIDALRQLGNAAAMVLNTPEDTHAREDIQISETSLQMAQAILDTFSLIQPYPITKDELNAKVEQVSTLYEDIREHDNRILDYAGNMVRVLAILEEGNQLTQLGTPEYAALGSDAVVKLTQAILNHGKSLAKEKDPSLTDESEAIQHMTVAQAVTLAQEDVLAHPESLETWNTRLNSPTSTADQIENVGLSPESPTASELDPQDLKLQVAQIITTIDTIAARDGYHIGFTRANGIRVYETDSQTMLERMDTNDPQQLEAATALAISQLRTHKYGHILAYLKMSRVNPKFSGQPVLKALEDADALFDWKSKQQEDSLRLGNKEYIVTRDAEGHLLQLESTNLWKDLTQMALSNVGNTFGFRRRAA